MSNNELPALPSELDYVGNFLKSQQEEEKQKQSREASNKSEAAAPRVVYLSKDMPANERETIISDLLRNTETITPAIMASLSSKERKMIIDAQAKAIRKQRVGEEMSALLKMWDGKRSNSQQLDDALTKLARYKVSDPDVFDNMNVDKVLSSVEWSSLHKKIARTGKQSSQKTKSKYSMPHGIVALPDSASGPVRQFVKSSITKASTLINNQPVVKIGAGPTPSEVVRAQQAQEQRDALHAEQQAAAQDVVDAIRTNYPWVPKIHSIMIDFLDDIKNNDSTLFADRVSKLLRYLKEHHPATLHNLSVQEKIKHLRIIAIRSESGIGIDKTK